MVAAKPLPFFVGNFFVGKARGSKVVDNCLFRRPLDLMMGSPIPFFWLFDCRIGEKKGESVSHRRLLQAARRAVSTCPLAAAANVAKGRWRGTRHDLAACQILFTDTLKPLIFQGVFCCWISVYKFPEAWLIRCQVQQPMAKLAINHNYRY